MQGGGAHEHCAARADGATHLAVFFQQAGHVVGGQSAELMAAGEDLVAPPLGKLKAVKIKDMTEGA